MEPNHALAAVALGAAKQAHSEIRIELPPAFGPDVETVRRALYSVNAKNQAGALAFVADVRLDEIAALRCWVPSREIDGEPHAGIHQESFSSRPISSLARRVWRASLLDNLLATFDTGKFPCGHPLTESCFRVCNPPAARRLRSRL